MPLFLVLHWISCILLVTQALCVDNGPCCSSVLALTDVGARVWMGFRRTKLQHLKPSRRIAQPMISFRLSVRTQAAPIRLRTSGTWMSTSARNTVESTAAISRWRFSVECPAAVAVSTRAVLLRSIRAAYISKTTCLSTKITASQCQQPCRLSYIFIRVYFSSWVCDSVFTRSRLQAAHYCCSMCMTNLVVLQSLHKCMYISLSDPFLFS